MWPFDAFVERRRKRRFWAAVAIYLAVHTFDKLDAAARASVDAEINRFSWRGMSPFPASALRKWASWDVLAAERALAMARLGIEPLPDGWSWKRLLRPWTLQPQMLIADFRPMDPVTVVAKEFLREQGLDVPDEDPWQTGSLESVDGKDDFLLFSGLRRYWNTKRQVRNDRTPR